MHGYAFADGFGRRFRSDERGEPLESLVLTRELSAAAMTATLLVERAARLECFRHPALARVRRIERRESPGGASVVLVSEAVPGTRLAERLQAPRGRLGLGPVRMAPLVPGHRVGGGRAPRPGP